MQCLRLITRKISSLSVFSVRSSSHRAQSWRELCTRAPTLEFGGRVWVELLVWVSSYRPCTSNFWKHLNKWCVPTNAFPRLTRMLLDIPLRHLLMPFISQLLIRLLAFRGAEAPSFFCKSDKTRVNTDMLLTCLTYSVILYMLYFFNQVILFLHHILYVCPTGNLVKYIFLCVCVWLLISGLISEKWHIKGSEVLF